MKSVFTEGWRFPRAIISCKGLFWGEKLSVATLTSKKTPLPLGEFNETIRKLHDIVLIQWSVDIIKHSKKPHFERWIKAMSPSLSLRKIIERFYGNLTCFFEHHSGYFKIHQKNGVVPILHEWDRLSENQVSRILKDLLPPWGCIDLKILAFLAGNSKSAEVFSLMLESDNLASRYHISYDTNKNPHVYRKEDSAIARGNFNCNNIRVMNALEAVLRFVPHVPHFWVPSNLCLSNLPWPDAEKIKSLGTKMTNSIIKGALVFSYYHGTLYVKRASLNPLLPRLPPCQHEYDQYKFSPMRVLKIAFCLPIAPTPSELCATAMFPSISLWAQNCAYSLWDIVEMFPELIEICGNREIRSKVRESYKSLAPTEGKENTQEEETEFENKLRQETPDVQKLMKLAGSPSESVFQITEMYDPNYREQPSQKRVNIVDPFTVPEFLSHVRANLADHDCVPWEVLKNNIMENRELDYRQRFWRTCQKNSVNSVTLLKWIKENPECGIRYREQRVKGANYFEMMFFRSDTTQVETGNEFLDTTKVIEEVIFQIRYLENQHGGNQGACITSICNAMPSDARKATKNYGGFVKFLQNHTDIFDLSTFDIVRLQKKKSTSFPSEEDPR